MSFQYYHRKQRRSSPSEKKHECIVYLETFYKRDEGVVDAYIDFRKERDLTLYTQNANITLEGATILELRSLKVSKRLRSGCYYKLNLDLLKQFSYTWDENSYLIGCSYNLSDMPKPKSDNDELLQGHSPLDPAEMSKGLFHPGPYFDKPLSEDLTVYVKNVGQANWNELRCGESVCVLFDAGAELLAKKETVKKIFDSRKADLESSKPILVISHWDVDHIHCLKYLNEEQIKQCFSRIICPDSPPSITKSAILSSFINALGESNVFCFPLPNRTDGVSTHLWEDDGRISLYQGEHSPKKNFCGLLMFVKGSVRSANYTGDCKLVQAKSAYDQEKEKGLTSTEHVLIAPHHGGDYGKSSRQYSLPCNYIFISVGKDSPCGHPHDDMFRYLSDLGQVFLSYDWDSATITLYDDAPAKLYP